MQKMPQNPNDRQGNPPRGATKMIKAPHIHTRDWVPPAYHPAHGPHAPYGLERMHEASEHALKGFKPRRCDKD